MELLLQLRLYCQMKRKRKIAVRKNIAMHPFVIVAFAAALAMDVFLISVYFFKFLKMP
jgi:hypothetical protein